MSAKPTLRVHTSCEPAMTPTVILPMLSLANSAETSESIASNPFVARAGDVWPIALVTSTTPQPTDINSALAAALREARHVQNLFVIGPLMRVARRLQRTSARHFAKPCRTWPIVDQPEAAE